MDKKPDPKTGGVSRRDFIKGVGGGALGTAILVDREGNFALTPGYYFYKQLTRAGKRGMGVTHTLASNPQLFLIAFAGQDSGHPDAFVLTSNIRIWTLPLRVEVKGTPFKRFRAWRSSEDGKEQFRDVGIFDVIDGAILYDPPAGTTTSFLGISE